MPVRLRLARHGQKHTPYYHIVAIRSTKRRDARPLEKLGEYDPIPRIPSSSKLGPEMNVFGEVKEVAKEKRIEWNVERIRWWLGVGAQPTKSVVKLLERGGVLTAPHKWQHAYTPGVSSPTQSALAASKLSTTSDIETVAESTESIGGTPDATGVMTGFEGKTAS